MIRPRPAQKQSPAPRSTQEVSQCHGTGLHWEYIRYWMEHLKDQQSKQARCSPVKRTACRQPENSKGLAGQAFWDIPYEPLKQAIGYASPHVVNECLCPRPSGGDGWRSRRFICAEDSPCRWDHTQGFVRRPSSHRVGHGAGGLSGRWRRGPWRSTRQRTGAPKLRACAARS
jgi:hypothetical protein